MQLFLINGTYKNAPSLYWTRLFAYQLEVEQNAELH